MKKLVLAITLSLATYAAFAQTNTTTLTNGTPASAVPVSDTFLNSLQGYFTSFGSNTWTGTKGFVETGAAYQKNINFGNEMKLGVDIKDLSTNLSVYAEAQAMNALGLGGVNSSEVGVALGYRLHDIQALVGLLGGYSFADKTGEGTVSFELQKKLTKNTHAFIEFAPTYESRSVRDYLIFGAGFSF